MSIDDNEEEESVVPDGQIHKKAPFIEYDGWKFLGTFQMEYDLWSCIEEDCGDGEKTYLYTRVQVNGWVRDGMYRIDEGPSDILPEDRDAFLECKRRHELHYHDPSVSPGAKR